MLKFQHSRPMFFHFSFFSLYLLIASFNVVGLAGAADTSGELLAGGNPFMPKAFLIRYWKKQVSNDLPKPGFLFNKASPLTAVELATFSKLADQKGLSTSLPSFCSSANLFCTPDLSPSLEKHDQNVKFSVYADKNFTNYGTSRVGGVDSFDSYADDADSFQKYSRVSTRHGDKFITYANIQDQSFNTYGSAATGGTGDFKNYTVFLNNPNYRFATYSDGGNGRKQSFVKYSKETNTGEQSFTSYGKNGNGLGNDFISYSNGSNVVTATFTGYGDTANGANDSFASYGSGPAIANIPTNIFKNYGDGGHAAVDSFKTYRDHSNLGDDSFQSYAKKSNAAKVNFGSYGQSYNLGSDEFSGYGEGGAVGQKIGFKIYNVNTTFKDYVKKSEISFARYNESFHPSASMASMGMSDKFVNKWVEPGKFFRENMLRTGTVMPMPDIRDKMPKRSFLPRVMLSKFPFATSKLAELKQIFHAGEHSSMEKILTDALSECERAPSAGETKRCVGSGEDMIDFAISVLGRDVAVRTTENTEGSKKDVLIGSVKGINGGKLTKSVSCHQSLFPYLLYYCHSVPKVRVYEADLLDPISKVKINHGVAICHVDTSSWSAGHGAFIALGSGPGKIEVCHWIFENDMTWTIGN